ncbi:hypothetical protein KII91_00645 [Leuconostoc gelidum subsp. gelidum]|uniref:hypothetical protein n=1 Tax=Leuconostoc gelidum TaxID=1244 RepID=UPI001CC66DF6|nr:hypothetical protein [Leuconostoc gelidum]MBZ5977850.1 hypothetical protein [Leuconostoc gelidum subsp. gelidum]MBZ6001220.1 hypothetical protein [Leuconostoc gelidum subsp. gelidum]
MAKKSIENQIKDATKEINTLDLQIKNLQDKKRQLKQNLQQLTDEQLAELGRQLLTKMNLDSDDLDAAFTAISTLPIPNQGGAKHED